MKKNKTWIEQNLYKLVLIVIIIALVILTIVLIYFVVVLIIILIIVLARKILEISGIEMGGLI